MPPMPSATNDTCTARRRAKRPRIRRSATERSVSGGCATTSCSASGGRVRIGGSYPPGRRLFTNGNMLARPRSRNGAAAPLGAWTEQERANALVRQYGHPRDP